MKILVSLTISLMVLVIVNGQRRGSGTRIYTSGSDNKNIGGGFKMGSFGGGINSIGFGNGGFGQGFGGYPAYQGGYGKFGGYGQGMYGGYGQGMYGGYGQGMYGYQQGYGGYGPSYGMKQMMMKKHYMNKMMY